jgi:hypothetical protein
MVWVDLRRGRSGAGSLHGFNYSHRVRNIRKSPRVWECFLPTKRLRG